MPRDANQVPVDSGVSSTDGVTPIPIKADPSNGALKMQDGGSDTTPPTNAKRNGNRVTTMVALSSVDGVTPVPLAVNETTGAILIST